MYGGTIMKKFLGDDFLLSSNIAKRLYHDYAEGIPIVDYHCHIDPVEIADDRQYESITDVWLGGDHYKWRAMRWNGIPERLITGDGDPYLKFEAWAKTIPNLIGNPLYHWTHLELKRYFGIDEPLSSQNAPYVYKTCNERLSRPDMTVRGIIHKSNVKLICTTDDPVDCLSVHARIASDPSCQVKILPAFRPDKAIAIQKPEFMEYIKKLGEASGLSIGSFKDLQHALKCQIDFFAKNGCMVSDHALETCVYEEATEDELDAILGKGLAGHSVTSCESDAFQTAVLKFLAGEYASRGWVMQLHFGCIRNNSSTMFKKLGSDTGFDAIDDTPNSRKLSRLLNAFESNDALPKMVLYSLNPADNAIIATVAGCFQTDSPSTSRIQMGSAWWFNDHRAGIKKHLTDLSNIGMLASFIGMLTDSRSYLSYTRHEYFRRILCDFLGRLVENGEYPNDMKMLGIIVKDICYYNAVRFFNFGI